MLDLRFIRSNPEKVRVAMRNKGEDDVDLDALLELDVQWRKNLQQLESLRAQRNSVSQEIGRLKKAGADASAAVAEMRQVSDRIKELEDLTRQQEAQLDDMLLRLPNLNHDDVPPGESEEDNVEVRRWGAPPQFDFEPAAHWDIGPALGVLDFEAAARVVGSRFNFFRGAGSRLVRALINFMIDTHVREHGYTEVWPPVLVHRGSMIGTGQLPKFEDDVFRIEKKDFFLIPTAEVPVTNLHREQILNAGDLPIKYVAYSPCFRAEAGAAGRDTRGLIRQHQFDKVELVKFVKPEDSYQELESLVNDAEAILQRLELPYRVMLMCAGETGFAAAKKYDLEVWMPSYGRYVEISSCSNFEAFQARRAGIRFRRAAGQRPEFVHTLNGSGVAIGRTIAAILENFQQADGSVRIPEALQPYFGSDVIRPD